MSDINELFFDLIRVSIGTQETLSRDPSTKEWEEMYKMAQKQSLIGICFVGVQKLYDNDNQKPRTQNSQPDLLPNPEPQTQNLNEVQYLTWMGMTAQIQKRNEVMNRQCVELTNKFRLDGFDVVVLKGQSAARRYGSLALLRQSGDIDAWLTGSREKIKKYITKNYEVGEVIYNHAHVKVFEDTEVEVHFTPSWLYSPIRNRKLQEWFQSFKVSGSLQAKHPEGPSAKNSPNEGFKFYENDGFKSPSLEFDLVYLMLHAYRHLMHEGLGLRQVMDYYFTLKAENSNDNVNLRKTMSSLGLLKFAGAMMYVMQVVFGLEEKDMICSPDEKRGKRLLTEIERGGNMGRGDDRTGKSRSRMGYFWEHVSRQWSFMRDYPSEVLWSPLWKTWHFVMRKTGRI